MYILSFIVEEIQLNNKRQYHLNTPKKEKEESE